MVIATFRPDTSMQEVLAVVAEEQAKVAALQAQGSIGAIYLATASRQTVFLEVFAHDARDAEAIAASLPMATWWDLDVYPLNEAARAQGAS